MRSQGVSAFLYMLARPRLAHMSEGALSVPPGQHRLELSDSPPQDSQLREPNSPMSPIEPMCLDDELKDTQLDAHVSDDDESLDNVVLRLIAKGKSSDAAKGSDGSDSEAVGGDGSETSDALESGGSDDLEEAATKVERKTRTELATNAAAEQSAWQRHINGQGKAAKASYKLMPITEKKALKRKFFEARKLEYTEKSKTFEESLCEQQTSEAPFRTWPQLVKAEGGKDDEEAVENSKAIWEYCKTKDPNFEGKYTTKHPQSNATLVKHINFMEMPK